MKYCEYCGKEITDRDWDTDSNGRKVFMCYSRDCQRMFHEDCRAADENAAYEAQRDNFDRYRHRPPTERETP